MVHRRVGIGLTLAPIAGLLASTLSLLVPLGFGALRPEYSHIQHYISELGETGAPCAPWVNWSGFLPVGLTLLVFLYAARDRLPVHRMSLWLFSCVGWDYLISAVFPCDPGCPERGSLSQQVHNLAAIITYPAVIAGLLQMATSFRDSRWWRHLSGLTMWCGMVVAAGFGCMLLPPWQPWRGLAQRVAEIAIFGWVVVISGALWRVDRSPDAPLDDRDSGRGGSRSK